MADDSGVLYPWLPDGEYRLFTSDNGGLTFHGFHFTVGGGDTNAVSPAIQKKGFRVNGCDLAFGSDTGWTFDADTATLTFDGSIPYALTTDDSFNMDTVRTIEAPAGAVLSNCCVRLGSTHVVTGGAGLVIPNGTLEFGAVDGPATITGGTVFADFTTCVPSNGVERVWPLIFSDLPAGGFASARFAARDGTELPYGREGIGPDEYGLTFLWFPEGEWTIDDSSDVWRIYLSSKLADFYGHSFGWWASVYSKNFPYTGIELDGEDLCYKTGMGWTSDLTADGIVVAELDGQFVCTASGSGSNVSLRAVRSGTRLVFDSLSIHEQKNGVSPLVIESDAVTLALSGTNSLDAVEVPGIRVSQVSSFTVTNAGEEAVLTVSGGRSAAGIGGGYKEPNGAITIAGGSLRVTGGRFAPAIGGGEMAAAGQPITISGGEVVAVAGEYAAAIGAPQEGGCGSIVISGGQVRATAENRGAGIGGGEKSTGGTVFISG
ncbi:MAG: hypothetical protein IKT12_05390, partial [Thermoguttaceae bacterium]|nr:hypothetical protein [Thermoguttaceae bacterium]